MLNAEGSIVTKTIIFFVLDGVQMDLAANGNKTAHARSTVIAVNISLDAWSVEKNTHRKDLE
jgi:hypothetical protein